MINKSFARTKKQVLECLKKTHGVLMDLHDRPSMKQHLGLKPAAPLFLRVKPFVKEFLQIEIFNKLEPAVLRIGGLKEETSVYLSTNEAYPDSANCQSIHLNKKRIEFTSAQGKERNAKFTRQFLYVCVESSNEIDLKVTISFGNDERQKSVPVKRDLNELL